MRKILGEYIRVRENEYKILRKIPVSWNLRELSRISGVPYTTVHRFVRGFRKRGAIHFIPRYEKLGLTEYFLITSLDRVERLPPFTRLSRIAYATGRKMRIIRALVPYTLIEEYKRALNLKIYAEVRGFEVRFYRPDSPRTFYSDGVIKALFSQPLEEEVKGEVREWYPVNKAPDLIDLAVITGKLARGPFIENKAAYELVKRYDKSLPSISKQLLSYHVREHVKKKYWAYNSVNIFVDVNITPFKYYYFEGRDAPIVARLLTNMPFFSFAIIEKNKAVVFGQVPCSLMEKLYMLLSIFDIKMPFGEIVLRLSNFSIYVPVFTRFVEEGRWVWKDLLHTVIK